MSTQTPESPFTRIPAFRTDTKVHRSQDYDWGTGAMCSNRYMIGTRIEALVSDVDCQHCIDWASPTYYEVRWPDRRYTTGYRVVYRNIGTHEEALRLAQDLGDQAMVEEMPR